MTTRIKLRRDTAANWTLNNPILAAGEPGLEIDTGKTKYGDGTTHWADLEYSNSGVEVRDAVGAFILHGPVPNYTEPNGADWWFDSVTTDADGNAYFVGGDKNYDTYLGNIHIVKMNSMSEVEWSKEYSWPEAYEGWGTSAVYNTATDQLTVVGTALLSNPGPANENTDIIFNVNPATGAIVGNVTTLRDEVISDGSNYGWLASTDVALLTNGDPVVVGSKQGNLQTYNLTTTTGCTTNLLFVDNNFPTGAYPVPYWDWYITGTNIVNQITLTGVNDYLSIPTFNFTGGTGTGVTFTISADGAGGYTLDGITGGTGYQVWNRIQILGSNLGGADGTNDAFVTINSVGEGGVPATGNVSGTSVGSSQYSSVSGTNVPSGSGGFVLNTTWRMRGAEVVYPNYADKYGFWLANGGDYYAVGDTVYLNPQDYGGITSATITVTSVSGNGTVLDFSIAPVSYNTATVKLITSNSVDFSVEGNWQALHRDEQAYIWTPTWSRLFGDTAWDRANAVATDSSGNIYIVGRTYDPYYSGGENRGLLLKVTSVGDLVWSKTFEPADYNDFNDGWTGVAIDHDDNVIVCSDQLVTKVDSDGVVLWQNYIGYDEPFSMWNACVDVDTDNNVYVAGEIDYMGNGNNDNFGIIKFDSDGVVQWKREAGTSQDEDTQWNNGYQILAIGGNKFYIAGSSYQGDDDVGFGISLPTDGSSTGTVGRFFYGSIDFVSVSTSTGTAQTVEIYFTATDFTVGTTSTFVATTSTVDNLVRALRTGDTKGRIENLYSISFEDGSEQTTAYFPGLLPSADSPRIYNTDNYYINREDAGRMMRWVAEDWYWGNSVSIYVPSDDIVNFDIGTQIHFMKDQGIDAFMFWPNDGMDQVTIIPAQPNYDSGMQNSMYNTSEGWSVRHPNWDQVPCIATLTKIAPNRWLLSCNSPTHVMDWNW